MIRSLQLVRGDLTWICETLLGSCAHLRWAVELTTQNLIQTSDKNISEEVHRRLAIFNLTKLVLVASITYLL